MCDDCDDWVKIDTIADLSRYIDGCWARSVAHFREHGVPDDCIEQAKRKWYAIAVENISPRIVEFLSDKEHREES
jgi:hypothetical protein